MNEDLHELLISLKSHGVEFLVIGAHAVSFHARPRITRDLDIWIGRLPDNVNRFRDAMAEVGAPIGVDGAARFRDRDRQTVRFGNAPNMVDLLNFAGETPFSEVYARRVSRVMGHIEVERPIRDDLIEMKRAAGRTQDLADIES